MPTTASRGRDLRIWTILGQLRDEVVRDIAQRLHAGQRYDEISAAVGVGKAVGRRKCAEIGAVLGLPPQRSQYLIDSDEVLRRVEAGEDDQRIAAALGRTLESVRGIRRKHGIRYFTQLRISVEEHAEIERRLLVGESTRTVAAAVGCEQADVQRRLRRVAHLIPSDLPPCACGKPRNHGGRCNLILDPALIRARLLSGRTAADIAREFDRTAQSFKPKYVQPVIDQLTAEGVTCGCGQPFGHQFACRFTAQAGRRRAGSAATEPAKRKRLSSTKLSREQLAAVKRRYRDRQSIRAISRATGIPYSVIQRLVRRWRETSKYDLRPCACGRPARHGGSCWVNKPGLVGKRHLARIEQGILAGRTSHEMAAQLKLSVMTVLKHSTPIRDRLFGAGVTCACGRPLNHNYWCSARWDAHDMPRGRVPLSEHAEAAAVEALLRGDLVADVAKAVGTGEPSIWRLRRSLSDEQRGDRAKAMRERLANGRGLKGEALMARIKAAVSSRIDPVLRDDVISEIYLAVIEGHVEAEQIGAVVRSFVGRGMAEWRSAYGPRSLSDMLAGDGNRTLADVVGDSTSTLAIDQIEIGRPPA